MLEPEKDDLIRSAEDLQAIFPDLPVFELPKLTREEILEIMRNEGDGTAQEQRSR